MTILTKDIHYLVISDLHLGHQKNPTASVISRLKNYLEQCLAQYPLDILFIAGDVYDRLLEFPSQEGTEIIFWSDWLITFCFRNSIKLRILNGTPSHDWAQSKIFDTINRIKGTNADVLYIDKLMIEYIVDLDLYVLYVPDEWSETAERTFEDVRKQLNTIQRSFVDIAIMHGMFTYQMPMLSFNQIAHLEQNYLSIVKYFISIGHVHTFSIFDRIVSQGSFDRNAHGEEELKGGVVFHLKQNSESSFHFIENKEATFFITLNIKAKTIEEVIEYISKKTKKWPVGSHCRLKAKKSHPAFSAIEELKKRFIDLFITRCVIEDKDNLTTPLFTAQQNEYSALTITKDNIADLLINGIVIKKKRSDEQLKQLQLQLKNVT